MRLVQFLTTEGKRAVAKAEGSGTQLQILENTERVYDLALEAWRTGITLEAIVSSRLRDVRVEYEQVIAERRLLPPLDHPDPAHCFVTGTGLTHSGSARARDAMHTESASGSPVTDSMRLFRRGLDGGKPANGEISVQPEWFYKGNGYSIVSPELPLPSPAFALDGGEEAELVGLYVVAETGEVLRVGFALGNEFSDHVMESQNYLYLAHSKLRACSFGPELRVGGKLPSHISGRVLIKREGRPLWEEEFLTGEDHMTYTISSLEHHHFKYQMFRRPGDVHCHFFGTATLSRNAGVVTRPGDVFEISAPEFGRPLRNALAQEADRESLVRVKAL